MNIDGITGIVLASLGLLIAMLPDRPEGVWPIPNWETAKPAQLGMDEARLREARDYALAGDGSGYIICGGKLVMAWGDPAQLYDVKSTTKSFGATALGVAIKDGRVRLEDKAQRYHPEFGVPPESNRATGWLDEITLRHLATHTAGFEKPGGYTPLVFEPGTRWRYSDGGPNWLAECLTLIYRQDLDTLMFERVFTPLGIQRRDLTWRKNSYRPHTIDDIPRREFGAGISANVDALARLGYLYLRGGRWQRREILPRSFVDAAGRPVPAVVGVPVDDPDNYSRASNHYGLLWWNNADGALPDVPRDAYWAWGLGDSLIVVIPSLDLVVTRAGKSWKRPKDNPYLVLHPFLAPIAASIQQSRTASVAAAAGGSSKTPAAAAPYPPSPVITGITWAPADSIIRKAKGSDNWPLTCADDDRLYTAYGDGTGFEPGVPEKLSLGFARVTGSPDAFTGTNIRSPAAEQKGDGAAGKKASGILMVDGVLYLWVRNAGNSQLACSTDHGRTWSWSDWKFTTSFGCPTFLNFGRNYAGARDGYVYVYSHDSDSAYMPADRMVMARVPKGRIRDRAAYEFFEKLDPRGQPVWTREIERRGAVFTHPGRCYRSGISYNAALKRYLWVQTLPGSNTLLGAKTAPAGELFLTSPDARFRGGFGIYDAPEPWGPWTTVFLTEEWDVGPGETASFPPRWMSADGKTVHLVFSGEDAFSVRKATLTVAARAERR